VLRTRDDARWLRHALGEHGHLAVIGAGFIGLEIAATARRLGVKVTIIEAAACPLENVLGPELGGWLARLHRAEGADVRPVTTVDRAQGRGTARRLCLSDGSMLEIDHAVVGIGISPEVAWLADSGLDASGGGRSTSPAGRRSSTSSRPEMSRPHSMPAAAGMSPARTGRRPVARAPRPHGRCSDSTLEWLH
jgi:NADPH-dependent 2,4-dienoyl-CoA reductase/sulfur reductase-like enzyme